MTQDSFYTKDFRHYQLLGWQYYINTTSFLVLKEMWAMEQTIDFSISRNVFVKNKIFSMSDKQIGEMLGISSCKTIKKAIEELEEFKLIKILGDRSKNKIGTATQYLITKPIPLPPDIKIPKTFLKLYGEIWCDKVIKELIILNNKDVTENLLKTDNPQEEDKKAINEEPEDKVKELIKIFQNVNEFQKFDVEDTVLKLLKKYPIPKIEIIANYFKQNVCNTNIRNLYGFLEYAIKNIEKYKIEKINEVVPPSFDELLKNSIVLEQTGEEIPEKDKKIIFDAF